MSQFPIALSDADLDRLADFTADVLDIVEAAEVARLVATDPVWAAAHAALVEADAAVRADLADIALSSIEPMPADVVARVDAALASAAIDADQSADVLPFTPRRSAGAAASRSSARSRRRVFAGVAAAAAAVAAIAGGISFTSGLGGLAGTGTSAERAADAPGPVQGRNDTEGGAGFAPPTQYIGGVGVLSSGTDYTLASLGRLAQATFQSGSTRTPNLPSSPDPLVPSVTTDTNQSKGLLSRLTSPRALEVCLAQVLLAHPGSVVVVDYARYDGAAALIVLVRQQTGSVVVAVGPECGLTGSDEKAAATA